MTLKSHDPATPSPAILSVRVSDTERRLLRSAAEQARTNVSDFVRRSALEAAEIDLMDRTQVIIPAERWAAMEALIDAPAQTIPAIAELARSSDA